MRKLFEQLSKTLAAFVEQRDDLLLLLSCSEEDSAIVLKLLSDLDRASSSDVFLLFGDDFDRPATYVSGLVTRLQEQIRAANLVLAAEKRPPLPAPPSALLDPSLSAAERLHEFFAAAKSLLPSGQGNRLVCALVPGHVADWRAYRTLIESCVPVDGIEPWMRNLRLVWRDEPGQTGRVGPRARRTVCDFGPVALDAAMKSAAEDPTVPEAERMQSLLMLAMMDTAHGRSGPASARFNTLLAYADKVDDPLTKALVLNGRGDLAQREKKFDVARRCYEDALDPAIAVKQAALLTVVVDNLAQLAFARKDFAEAESYYNTLASLAVHMNDPNTRARALSERGLSQEQLKKYDQAVASFEEAALLGQGFELVGVREKNWEHVRRVARQAKRKELLAEVDAELKKLPAKAR